MVTADREKREGLEGKLTDLDRQRQELAVKHGFKVSKLD